MYRTANLHTHYDIWKVNSTSADTIWPAVGDGDANRTGDMIQATGMKIRGVFEIPNDRFNMRMKIWYVQWNTGDGTPSTQSEFFHNISGNIMLDPIQNKRFRSIKYLGEIKCRPTDIQNATAQTLKTGGKISESTQNIHQENVLCTQKNKQKID